MALAKLQRKCFGENRSHVAEAHGKLKEEKNPARFQHKNPCKLQANMLKPLDFPRENSMIFEMKIIVSLWRKRHFFEKRSKRWRGFPPDGMFVHRMCSLPVLQSTTLSVAVFRSPKIESKRQVPSTSISVAQPRKYRCKRNILSNHIKSPCNLRADIPHIVFTPFCDLPVSCRMVLKCSEV